MRISNLRSLLIPAVAILALQGCSDGEAGTASPSSTGASGQASTSLPTETEATSDAGSASTADLDACSFLSRSTLSQFGDFETGVSEELGGARGCSWLPARDADTGADRLPTVYVGIRDSQSVETVNDLGSGVRTGDLNGRNVAQTSGNGGCIIALAVGDASRVDVGVSGVPAEEGCRIAEQVAEMVEPKLPEG